MDKTKKILKIYFFILVFLAGVVPAVSAQVLLKQGSTGNDVYLLQVKLQEMGYYQGDLDSTFGSELRSAVINFQLNYGLVPDGIVGRETWLALRNFKFSDASRGQGIHSNNGWRIAALAQQYYGVPYVWAGRSPSGFDCSGFVFYVFGQQGVSIPRMADEQFKVGVWIDRSDLQMGDLVFFSTYEPGPSHVGIYIGNGQFIHASSGAGRVIRTSLYSDYYQSRYLGARRVL
ncbi:hypothetical protein P22_1662 [Propionispora sp. 2/2-37]|uniref:C40 family peptidase n=1 Tax=Propionispora sp. 2/2-37 TaxID=1677858 RepID=UPI0006C4DE9C|nr:NlpC/P60 family protein [Propionispora sp. 2/2-37]CUH95588.1 hypothetical protein P22_1662 [Propionispora sp. 2/2-37]